MLGWKRLKPKQRRILIARTDNMGDLVSTIPMLEALHWAGYDQVSVLVRASNAPLLEGNPYLRQCYAVDENNPSAILPDLLRTRFDTLIAAVNDALLRALLPELHGIPERIGPLSDIRCLLHYNFPVRQKRSLSTANEGRYNLDLLEVLGIQASDIRPRIYLQKAELQRAQAWVAARFPEKKRGVPLIAVHSGMRGSALNLKEEYYQSLVHMLLEDGMQVALTGHSPAEQSRNSQLLESVPRSKRDYVGDVSGMPLRRFIEFLSQVDVYVGPSTGPTHLASAVGIKFIGIYPPIRVQSATRWAPFAADPRRHRILQIEPSLCGQQSSCAGEKCPHYYCLDQITPQLITAAVCELLQVE